MFCSELASRLHCYVVAGYPEALPPDECCTRENSSGGTPDSWNIVGANSAVLYGPVGEWVGGYRKTNLFMTDLPWAKAGRSNQSASKSGLNIILGTGFATFHLPAPLGKLTIGICMDLNPRIPEWYLEDGPYELADYCVSENVNTVVLCNAWLDSRKGGEDDGDTDLQTVRYWAARLRPLWTDDNDHAPNSSSKLPKQGAHSDTIVIACNRTGFEKGKCIKTNHFK